MRGLFAIIVLASTAAAGFFLTRRRPVAGGTVEAPVIDVAVPFPDQVDLLIPWTPPIFSPTPPDAFNLVESPVLSFIDNAWTPPARANPFIPHINAAEDGNRIPDGLLARLLHQESRFRDDIISGQTQSGAGAIGIAQIVPRWHPNVDPFNPIDSIYYAAGYLRNLFERFGTWPLALAAYNMGPTALQQIGGDLTRAPLETRNYVREITGDVPV